MAADEPHVGLPRLVGAEPHDLARLQDAQQLRLHVQRHVADLVEEQRAPVGVLEDALAVALGAGERTAHVAEELVLEQRLALPGGVERHVALLGPLGVLVDRRGDQLLARARFARDQDGDVARGDLLDRRRSPAASPPTRR